jgi:hypothetical protein
MGRKVTSRTISVSTESDDDLRQLANWLRDEDDLRGRVRLVEGPVTPGQMGGVVDAVELIATSGTATALVRSLFGWLRHCRTAKRVTVRFGDSELRCGSADDAALLLARLSELVGKD